ncbi:MAG: AI-2E family transporter [Alphaproteobacteria bacterium]
MADQPAMKRPPLLNTAILAAIMALTVIFLIVAKNLLIPFVIAIVFWYLIDVLAETYMRLPLWRWRMPRWLGLVLAILSFVVGFVVVINFVTANFTPESLQQVARDFQTNLGAVVKRGLGLLPFKDGAPTVAQLVEKIDFGVAVGGIVSAVTGIAGDIGIIIVYVIFLLLEQITFRRKFDSLIKDRERREHLRRVIERIGEDIQLYIRIKFILALIAAAICYAFMRSVDLRFAEVWGILIFFMAWIPTVGPIIGLVFPLVFSIVQFTSLGPILVVALGVGVTQSVLANIVEPKLMGSSLNLSPLVVIVSLVVWGTIWGVTGMFLCVPIMVIVMIVLSNFQDTRPIAVLLSSDGKLRH